MHGLGGEMCRFHHRARAVKTTTRDSETHPPTVTFSILCLRCKMFDGSITITMFTGWWWQLQLISSKIALLLMQLHFTKARPFQVILLSALLKSFHFTVPPELNWNHILALALIFLGSLARSVTEKQTKITTKCACAALPCPRLLT